MREEVWKIAEFIMKNDRLFEFLGAQVVDVDSGFARLKMRVDEKHLNAMGVCQGGVIFTFADLAFAIASNSHGEKALSASSSISYFRPAKKGDVLLAEAREQNRGKHLSHYLVRVFREDGTEVALFAGVAFNLGRGFWD